MGRFDYKTKIMEESLALKDAIALASPLIKSVVDTFVTPKLQNFKKKFKAKEKINLMPTSENFTEYYHRTFKKLIVVNTLVFNNSQKLLDDIYIPLTIQNSQDKDIKAKIEGFPSNLSDEYGNILITDTAGMGKSTLLKTIFIDCIYKSVGIPIFIELRRLSKNKTILDEIIEQLNSIDKNFDQDLLVDLISEGDFIFILDGYDEIILKDRDVVTSDIQGFISKADSNRFFITSRPEKALLSFGNFQEFRIQPLNKKEAFELLRKYDKQGPISALLIKKLQEKELENISEFLINPLLVSLLFTAFEHKQSIPFKKYLFYRQVYDANFENHDLTKGESYIHDKYSQLEIDDFHRVLRQIGFACLKIQQIEFTKDELLKLISESKSFCIGLDFKESDFLLDILKTVPLFTQDGNYYRWSHKSLQEYFAAQFIYLDSKDKQNGIISKLYNHVNLEKYINVLDLYYDMDYKTFRSVIEVDFLKDYYDFQRNNYKNYKGVIDEGLIIERLELTFLNDSYIFKGPHGSKQSSRHKSSHFVHNVREMIDRFSLEKNIDSDRFNGLLPRLSTNNIFSIHYFYPKKEILYLLNNKNNSIVRSLKMSIDYDKRKKLDIGCEIESDYTLLKVDDSLPECFNEIDNFRKVNDMLFHTKFDRVVIDHNKALEKYEIIKKELECNLNISLLDGF